MELTIGVDVGGTKIAAGVVDPDGRLLQKVRVSTPASTAEDVEEGIVQAVRKLRAGHDVSAVGLAVPGFVDEARSTLRFTPNLPMVDRPLRETVGRAVGLPVVVENDANAAAWGEWRFGGGRGLDDMVLVTVGTGIGGGTVIDRRLLRGAFGTAGEFGHVRVVPDGLPCGCGKSGCWEKYASGSALVASARALVRERPDKCPALVAAAGDDPGSLAGHVITELALSGDAACTGLLAELGGWLGAGIADLADVLDPAVVVVGGGVCEAGDLLLAPARAAYARMLSGSAHRPHLRIVAAELGNEAGLVGAADLARLP